MSSVWRIAIAGGLVLVGAHCAGHRAGGFRRPHAVLPLPVMQGPTVARAARAPAIDPDPSAGEPELESEVGPVDEILLGWADDAWMYLPTYVDIIRGTTPAAHLMLVVDGFEQQFMVAHELAREGVDLSAIEFVHAELDSMWMRDYGPLIVRTRDGQRRIVDAQYGRRHDDEVPEVVAKKLGWTHEAIPIELDGGHVQSDGQGHCIVSEDVLYLNAEDGRSEEETLGYVRDYLGCRQITLVPPLLVEETGHVDVFLYVTGPRHVLLGRYRPDQDAGNHRRLEETARTLASQGYQVDRIPMPGNSHRTIFRTYTNALAANHVLLVPTYRRDRRYERTALGEYRRLFPDRSIVPVRADDVIELGGALHCLAMTVEAR